MKRSRTHQIDELAQQFLRAALPATWVVNEQPKDYAKDYLVEIGDDNGDLTGSSFFVQLKGQEEADLSADGSEVKYSLKSKYAGYYLDKVQDLPVLLVVVNVDKKKGWWLFLQPVLEADQAWRKQDSVTVRLPNANDVTNTTRLRAEIGDAKKWMRLHHPASIHESVAAHKERIIRTDPRFDVQVSLVDDKPHFTLLAREDVTVGLEFAANRDRIGDKIRELFDKGAAVDFEPGEVKVTGSRLFEPIETAGCTMQIRVNLTGTVSLACCDSGGRELARISNVPGRFSGGQKETWFEGELPNSPFAIKVGPITQDGRVSLTLGGDLRRWEDQRLRQLAHFDKFYQFFRALPQSASTLIECQQDGNRVLWGSAPLHRLALVAPLARYLEVLSKARNVSERFEINPVWTFELFDRDARETAEELYGIFFEDVWSRPMPNRRLTATCVRETFRFDVARQAKKPEAMRLTSNCTYGFLGNKIEVGRLVYDYTDMTIKVKDDRKPSKQRQSSKARRKAPRSVQQRVRDETVEVVFTGTKTTVMSVRRATPEDA